MANPSVAIQAVELTVRFTGRQVLQAVTLAIAHGEIVALTGDNGAGKTTLLRRLACFTRLIPAWCSGTAIRRIEAAPCEHWSAWPRTRPRFIPISRRARTSCSPPECTASSNRQRAPMPGLNARF